MPDTSGLRITIASLMVLAVITDVFDGIIARKLNISSDRLRLYDSNADQLFWIVALVAVFYLSFDFFKAHYPVILSIVFLELIAYIICFSRWKKSIATHSILAKFFTLSLMVFLLDLCIQNTSYWTFYICAVIGIVSRLELIAILITLKKWTMDVPSIFAVRKINNGEPIQKNKLFNS